MRPCFGDPLHQIRGLVMVLRLLLTSLFILLSGIGGLWAQTPARPATPLAQPTKPAGSAGTVGIITGDIDGTGIRIASDLSRVLDNGNELRVIPIIGKGSVQNIS